MIRVPVDPAENSRNVMGDKSMKKRVSAVIVNDGNILLIRRIKPDKEYYTFPGGSVEEGENERHAMRREIKEELSVNAVVKQILFEIENQGRKELYFLIGECMGVPRVGGPEKERMNEKNQYHIEWIELSKIEKMDNVYPQEAVKKVLESLRVSQ